jgi:peptidoglycan/LPS O-acetylase OafA/YrhL
MKIVEDRKIYLDIARFFAIFGVIAVHSAQVTKQSWIPIPIYELGRFGVQLFFLISGVTILLTYEKLNQKYINPKELFLIRRFFRIAPLFIVLGIVYSQLKSVSLVHTLTPFALLDPHRINIIAGGWSIWNEMFFYLLFIFYVPLRNNFFKFNLFFITLCIFSFLINFRYFGSVPDSELWRTYDYENFATQALCFFVGVEFAANNFRRILYLCGLYILPSIYIKIFYFEESFFKSDYGANYWIGAIALLGVCFLQILAFIERNSLLLKNNFPTLFLAYFGRLTYTAYMVHFFVIELFRDFLENQLAEINILFVCLLTFSITRYFSHFSEGFWSKLGHSISGRLGKLK